MSDDNKTMHDRDHRDPADSFGNGETISMASLTGGMEFGRYRIVRRIGSGGMGTVYAASDPTLDRTVALKVLHDRVEGADAEQRLLREAQAMARLNHPNVVTVHDAGMKDGRPYVAMEFVEGCDLQAWLKREKGSVREIVDLFVAAGDGLSAAHAAGLIHRDFKPGNIMVGNDGRVRVTDFGLARAAEVGDRDAVRKASESETPQPAGTASISALDTPLTQAGTVLGTPAAPIIAPTSTPFVFLCTSRFLTGILWANSPIFPSSSPDSKRRTSARRPRAIRFPSASWPRSCEA
jgi:serine/threonine protein kinase